MIEFFRSLLFPTKCLLCGEVLPDADKKTIFCPKCRLEYEKLCRIPCGACGKRQTECRCRPEALQFSGIRAAVHLFEFDGPLSRRLIYTLKEQPLRSVPSFFAGELAKTLTLVLGDTIKEYAVAYAPRKPKSVRLYGFDQAKRLGMALADCLRLPCYHMFTHAVRSEKQKELTAEERTNNAKISYVLRQGFVPEHKKLILVDDVITTGSTASRLVFLAMQAGIEEIVFASVARTPYHKKERRKEEDVNHYAE